MAPTKLFLSSTGYGCFTYIPFLWLEDVRLTSGEEVFHLQQHFYSLPGIYFLLVHTTFMPFPYMNIYLIERTYLYFIVVFVVVLWHGYSTLHRKDRAFALQIAGIILCMIFFITGMAIFINEAYHRRKFMARVYVD